MKKIALISAFVLAVFFFNGQKVYAQQGGTCRCSVGESRTCEPRESENFCASGYVAQCVNLCNGNPSSCECVPLVTPGGPKPGNCSVVGQRCGGINDPPCCSATCYQGYCAPQSQLIPTSAPGSSDTNGSAGGQFDPFAGCPTNQVNTAIGCIPTDPSLFIGKFLGLGIGIAGGIAFLLILFGGFQILTSAGNPEQLNAGRELVGSAVTGLLLIIFSVFLLRLIGYDILRIPGFK